MERMTASTQRGFSLVELLVSMTLLAAIVALSGFAFQQFSRYWDGRLGVFDESFSEMRNGWLLTQVISKVQPYAVLNQGGLPRFYFEGNRNGFVAVSSESLSIPDAAAVIRLSLLENKDRTFDLVYEESVMKNFPLTRLSQALAFSPPVTLFTDLRDPSFEYFGPIALDAEAAGTDAAQPDRWSLSYNSAVTGRHAKIVRAKWLNDAGNYSSWRVNLIQPLKGHLSLMYEDPSE